MRYQSLVVSAGFLRWYLKHLDKLKKALNV